MVHARGDYTAVTYYLMHREWGPVPGLRSIVVALCKQCIGIPLLKLLVVLHGARAVLGIVSGRQLYWLTVHSEMRPGCDFFEYWPFVYVRGTAAWSVILQSDRLLMTKLAARQRFVDDAGECQGPRLGIKT